VGVSQLIQPKLAKTEQKPPATTSHASSPPSGNAAGSGPADAGNAFSESSAGPDTAAIDSCAGILSIDESGESFGEDFIPSSNGLDVPAMGVLIDIRTCVDRLTVRWTMQWLIQGRSVCSYSTGGRVA